jgi:hypothetical protein
LHRNRTSLGSDFNACVGREQLCKSIVASAHEAGAVLVFGGRQAGKTTVLLKITNDLSVTSCTVDDLCSLTVPVYVDLMKLNYDASPRDFFRTLTLLALEACRRQIAGFELQSLPKNLESDKTLLDCFIADVHTLFEAAGNVDIYFIFLLDEAKRVLFDRFPRGFQDNLFALLFGETSISSHCSMVFAGAQDLYRFCEDDTSPIGSRAEKQLILNLSLDDLTTMVLNHSEQSEFPKARSHAEMIYAQTGGHAGLSAYLAKKLDSTKVLDADNMQALVKAFQVQHSELFQIWTTRLSIEARLILKRLLFAKNLTLPEAARVLQDNNKSSFLVDRVFDELQFTGIAIRREDHIAVVNQMYATVARHSVVEDRGSELERPVWALLEELEVTLRRVVRLRFEEKWPGRAEKQMALCLGNDSWKRILDNKNKYDRSYRQSAEDREPDILDFTYLGQLGQLMIWQSSWDMFKQMFRDKRELEDMLRDISPVRNDSAHFRSVPKRELDRCRLRCEDLLVIFDKNVPPVIENLT